MQLYLDCDGVLADFDRAATKLLHMQPRQFEKRYGRPEFWKRLARHPDFYGTLPMFPDAMVLFNAVRHLNPIILTVSGQNRKRFAGQPSIPWGRRSSPALQPTSGDMHARAISCRQQA
jgi:hypothetical protein